MRILYCSQYFPPEMGAPSARVHELSRSWVKAGHSVTVLTAFAHHPTGIKSDADRGVFTRRERLDGIDVLRSYVWASANKGVFKRMLSYASFMFSAVLIGAVRARRPQIIIATSPQLLSAVSGWMLAHFFRCPFVFEVRDLWPESILAVEAMRDNILIRMLKRLADFLYRRSGRVVTVGKGYRRAIHRLYDIPLRHMAVIPNGIDTRIFIPRDSDNDLRLEYGWGDRFVCLYIGTHGMAHGLEYILETAELLRNDKKFIFVFVGEGAEKEKLKLIARDLDLPNVSFVDQQAKDRVPRFYAACDLGLVTLRNTPLFQEVLPSKIFEYLGMQRPIICTVGGEAQELVLESGGGIYVSPEDPVAMALAVQALAEDRPRLAAMGLSGRRYVLTFFDRETLAARYLTLLQSLLTTRFSRSQPQRKFRD